MARKVAEPPGSKGVNRVVNLFRFYNKYDLTAIYFNWTKSIASHIPSQIHFDVPQNLQIDALKSLSFPNTSKRQCLQRNYCLLLIKPKHPILLCNIQHVIFKNDEKRTTLGVVNLWRQQKSEIFEFLFWIQIFSDFKGSFWTVTKSRLGPDPLWNWPSLRNKPQKKPHLKNWFKNNWSHYKHALWMAYH